jgi:hypothetical protein
MAGISHDSGLTYSAFLGILLMTLGANSMTTVRVHLSPAFETTKVLFASICFAHGHDKLHSWKGLEVRA